MVRPRNSYRKYKIDPRIQDPFERFAATAGFIAFFLLKLLETECIFIIQFYFSPFNVYVLPQISLVPALIWRDFEDRVTQPRPRPLITFTFICALLVPDSCDPAAVCVQDNDVTSVLKNMYSPWGHYINFHELNYTGHHSGKLKILIQEQVTTEQRLKTC